MTYTQRFSRVISKTASSILRDASPWLSNPTRRFIIRGARGSLRVDSATLGRRMKRNEPEASSECFAYGIGRIDLHHFPE